MQTPRDALSTASKQDPRDFVSLIQRHASPGGMELSRLYGGRSGFELKEGGDLARKPLKRAFTLLGDSQASTNYITSVLEYLLLHLQWRHDKVRTAQDRAFHFSFRVTIYLTEFRGFSAIAHTGDCLVLTSEAVINPAAFKACQ